MSGTPTSHQHSLALMVPASQAAGHHAAAAGPQHVQLIRPASLALVWQVFTASVFSLAHGSNDVANSIGPYAAIYSIYKTSQLSRNADVPVWILAVGAHPPSRWLGCPLHCHTCGSTIAPALTLLTPGSVQAVMHQRCAVRSAGSSPGYAPPSGARSHLHLA